jgi:hypothetical protein
MAGDSSVIPASTTAPTEAVGSLARAGVVILLLMMATIFLSGVILQIGVTPDFPWLLAAGDWILQHRQLPATDLFSWTAADRPWVLYQWGFEALLAAIHHLAGYDGVAVVFAWAVLITYLIVPLVSCRQRTPVMLLALLNAPILVVLTVNMSIRPMIVTSGGLLLQHLLIEALRRRAIDPPKACCAVFLIYVAWANLHTGFTLGIIALLLTMVGDWLEPRLRRGSERPAALAPMQVSALIVAATFGSMLTPYGLQLHMYVASLASAAAINARIDELSQPDYSFKQFQLFLALVLLFVVAVLRQPRAARPADILLVASSVLATLFAARFVVWAALYLSLMLPDAVARAWPSVRRTCTLPSSRSLTWIIALATLMVPPSLIAYGVTDPVGPLCKPVLPAIHAYLAARSTHDHLLTDPITGSCMIAAAPGVPVFIDTRFDFYGSEFSTETLDALAVRPGWNNFLSRYAINIAVLERSRPLAQAFAVDKRFSLLYGDDEAVVVRRLP